MPSTVSLSVLAAEVEAARARLVSMEAKLDQLLVALAEHDAQMGEMHRVRVPSAHGFSMSNQLDGIRGILEREFNGGHAPWR